MTGPGRPAGTAAPDTALLDDAAMSDAATEAAQGAVFRLAGAVDLPGLAPLSAIRAAVLIGRAARGEARRHVARGRAAGLSWDELAGAVDAGDGPGDGQAAYEWVTGLPGARAGLVYWRCPSCGEPIADSGPYDDHPDDNESGHAETCARRAADLTAWRNRTRTQDEHVTDRCPCCGDAA